MTTYGETAAGYVKAGIAEFYANDPAKRDAALSQFDATYEVIPDADQRARAESQTFASQHPDQPELAAYFDR